MRLSEKLAEMQHKINGLESELRKHKNAESDTKKIKSGGR
jgi:hypothetical protein